MSCPIWESCPVRDLSASIGGQCALKFHPSVKANPGLQGRIWAECSGGKAGQVNAALRDLQRLAMAADMDGSPEARGALLRARLALLDVLHRTGLLDAAGAPEAPVDEGELHRLAIAAVDRAERERARDAFKAFARRLPPDPSLRTD